MKIYLASSWRNLYQSSVLCNLRDAGHEVYDFKNPAPGNNGFSWTQIDPDYTPAPTTASYLLELLNHPIAQIGFQYDFDAMKWADGCVLLLPSGASAHLEAGWFAGQGKPVAVLAPEIREPELMYKCFERNGVTPLFSNIFVLVDYLNTL